MVPREPRVVGADQVRRLQRYYEQQYADPARAAERRAPGSPGPLGYRDSRDVGLALRSAPRALLLARRCRCSSARRDPVRRRRSRRRDARPRPRRPPPTSAGTARRPSVLAFSGHGWGHGLGMSQWGAYGYAQHGWTYDRILAHYYSGTTLGPAPRLDRPRAARAGEAGDARLDGSLDGRRLRRARRCALDPGTLTLRPELASPKQPLVPPLTFTGAEPLARQRQGVPRQARPSRPTASALQVVDTRRRSSRT